MLQELEWAQNPPNHNPQRYPQSNSRIGVTRVVPERKAQTQQMDPSTRPVFADWVWFDMVGEVADMADSFYWYDLETTGTNPKWDRIVQFAGIRTDLDLNPIGEPLCFFVRLPMTCCPVPSLVTGITPSKLAAEGISEFDALQNILQEFNVPGTCALGYNSLRFDDEFMRYALYRHLQDLYARSTATEILAGTWLTWCVAGALRPGESIGLPMRGQTIYRLEELTKANGIDHGQAHDAMSDVHATIGMARLLKDRQPKLFDITTACVRRKM